MPSRRTMVILALVVYATVAPAAGTAGWAAVKKYLITSTSQISPKVLKQLHGAQGVRGLPGPAGPTEGFTQAPPDLPATFRPIGGPLRTGTTTTATTAHAGKLLLYMAATATATCPNDVLMFLTVDGQAVRGSVIRTPGAMAERTMVGVTDVRVAAGQHTIAIDWQCVDPLDTVLGSSVSSVGPLTLVVLGS